MKKFRQNISSAFAEGFARGFYAPAYFIAGDKIEPRSEQTVKIKATIRLESHVAEKIVHHAKSPA